MLKNVLSAVSNARKLSVALRGKENLQTAQDGKRGKILPQSSS